MKGVGIGMNCSKITAKDINKTQLSNIVLVLSTPSIRGWIQAELWINCEVTDKCIYAIDGKESKSSIAKYLFLRFFSRSDSLKTLLKENNTLIVIYLDNANRKHYYERYEN